MKKIYKYKNGVVHVLVPDKCDRKELHKVTEEFLKKIIAGGNK